MANISLKLILEGPSSSLCKINNHSFLLGSSDGKIKICSLSTKTHQVLYESNKSNNYSDNSNSIIVYSLSKMSEVTCLAGFGNGEIKIINLNLKKCVCTLKAHKSEVYALSKLTYSTFLSGSSDCLLKVWNSFSKTLLKTLSGHLQQISCICKLSKNVFISGAYDKVLKIWEVSSLPSIANSKTFKGHTSFILSICKMSSNVFISGAFDKTIMVWDINANSCILVFQFCCGAVFTLCKLTNLTFASGSFDGKTQEILIWSLNAKLCLAKVITRNTISSIIRVTNNNIVTGSYDDNKIRVWKLK